VKQVLKSDVLVDVCTQWDYLDNFGNRPCGNAAAVAGNLRHLIATARWLKLPVLSCAEVRRPDEVRGLARPDCVYGTRGHEKLGCTLLPRRVVIESDNRLCVPLDILERFQQAILAKRHRDPFTNPKLDRLLTEMPAERFVVFGVSLEVSIRLLALGLLLRGRRVAIVPDACGYWNQSEADMSLRQLTAKGCELLSTERFIQSALIGLRPTPSLRNNRNRFVA
jgi:nicotinamidase-related amidase